MRKTKRFLAWAMAAVMTIAVLPVINKPLAVHAESDKTIASVGANVIAAPKAPTSWEDYWTGNYVWYGKYEGEPLKYRVLDPYTEEFGGKTMLLDCNTALYQDVFAFYDENGEEIFQYDIDGPKPSEWSNSYLKANMNGYGFYLADDGFTDEERAAIAESTKASHPLVQGTGAGECPETICEDISEYKALNGEKIFALDVEDVHNPTYGYINSSGDAVCRMKFLDGGTTYWWLRSNSTYGGFDTAFVYGNGSIFCEYYVYDYAGISPAFNLNLSSILFTSLVSGNVGDDNAEYKLTIADENMKLAVPKGQKVSADGKTVTVPYSVTGSDAANTTRISVLILDQEYAPGNEDGAEVIYYDELNVSGDFATTGVGTFTLPNQLELDQWGESYYVYVLAEDENDLYETDYASEPLLIEKPGSSVDDIYAELSDVTNSTTGVVLSWVAPENENVVKYRVLRKENDGNFTAIAKVGNTTYTDKNAEAGKTYTYTIRYMDASGAYVGTYDKTGKSITVAALMADVLPERVSNGVKLTWNAVDGAEKYRIFRKTEDGQFSALAKISNTTYVDKTVEGGKTYYYTVRCMDASGSYIGTYDSTGKSITIEAEKRADFNIESTENGVKISWNAVDGVAKYRVMRKAEGESKFTAISKTAATSCVDKTAENGKTYTYTVRCMDETGAYIGSYDTAGKSITFVTDVEINEVNFPDEAFRTYLTDNFDSNHDGFFSKDEIAAVTEMTCDNMSIQSLKGIEKFKALTRLSLTNNQLTELDLSSNTELVAVVSAANPITSINVNNCTKLKTLGCDLNLLTTIDVSGNPNLETLGLSENPISDINLTNNRKLKLLYVGGTNLSDLDISRCDFLLDAYEKGYMYTSQENTLAYEFHMEEEVYCLVFNTDVIIISEFIDPDAVDFSLEIIDGKYVSLNWETFEGAEKYRILRKVDGEESFTPVAKVSGTSYLDRNVEYGKKYIYTIRCIDSSGVYFGSYYKRGKAIEVYGQTEAVFKYKFDGNGLTISWQAVEGASKYRVLRKVEGEDKFTPLVKTSKLSYYDTAIEPGVVYYYTVRCMDDTGAYIGTYNVEGRMFSYTINAD